MKIDIVKAAFYLRAKEEFFSIAFVLHHIKIGTGSVQYNVLTGRKCRVNRPHFI